MAPVPQDKGRLRSCSSFKSSNGALVIVLAVRPPAIYSPSAAARDSDSLPVPSSSESDSGAGVVYPKSTLKTTMCHSRVRVRVMHGHWLPRLLGLVGIVLFPFVLFAEDFTHDPATLEAYTHELIHVQQIRRSPCGPMGFYVSYVAEFLCYLVVSRCDRRAAYRRIS